MSTVPQNAILLKHLFQLLDAHRPIFGQQRVYERAVALFLAEVVVFARHTVTQLLLALGQTERDWSAWYRLFSQGRFDAERASAVLVGQTLQHVGTDEVYVVAGDGTQTARSSAKLEGVGWLRHVRTPPFKVGIHRAQRWFTGCWLVPAEHGYSRALPLRLLPAFTPKARRRAYPPAKEWEAALAFLHWLRQQLVGLGRAQQRLLLLGDGSYDTLGLWQQLPEGVVLLARSAKNRVLYQLPATERRRGRPRQYGERAPTPQQLWQQTRGWTRLTLTIRGGVRHLQYRVSGPVLRRGAPGRPLFVIVVRGKQHRHHRRPFRREPLPFLVNAVRGADDQWQLPLPVETLLFWAWQRWEIEVCHRELKSGFGLGNKQCFHPVAAVASVQWSAWVYAVLLLAGYRTFGLSGAPAVPSRWWRGAGRWSLTTLWRCYRAALWGQHQFRPLAPPTPVNRLENLGWLDALRHAAFGAARA